MWPATLNELQGHSPVSELYKISTGTPVSHGPSATAGLLVRQCIRNTFFLNTMYMLRQPISHVLRPTDIKKQTVKQMAK